MGEVKIEDLDWATGAWLVLEAVRKPDDTIKGVKVVKAVQNYPHLSKNQIAVKFEVILPAKAFDPQIEVVLKITEDMLGSQVIQAEVL